MTQSQPKHQDKRSVSLPRRVSSLLNRHPSQTIFSADYLSLLNELAQARSLNDERVERIYHLEQALDQALICLEELRVQIRDQHLLETQLATTEEFGHIQKQAIARLRMQLDQQQKCLTTQSGDAAKLTPALQEFQEMLQFILCAQTTDHERLQDRLIQDRMELSHHCDRLETQVQELQMRLDERQRRIIILEAEVLTARSQIANLQVQIDVAQQQVQELLVNQVDPLPAAIAPDPTVTQLELPLDLPTTHDPILNTDAANLAGLKHSMVNGLEPYPPQVPSTASLSKISSSTTAIASLEDELTTQQVKVEELETYLAKQRKLEARWQQRAQELQEECDRYRAKASQIDHQIAEMQEQILKQTRQAGEYEATIHHWKDRYAESQQYLQESRELLEQTLLQLADTESHLTQPLSDLLNVLHQSLAFDQDGFPLTATSPVKSQPLPDFLRRRRNYRKRPNGS